MTGSGNTASSVSTPVSFLTNGTVTAVNVEAGDTVTAGEVLATIDPTSAKATLRTAQAQLGSARAAYDQAASGPTAVKQQDQLAVTTRATAGWAVITPCATVYRSPPAPGCARGDHSTAAISIVAGANPARS